MKEKNLVVVDDQLVAKHNLEILSAQDDLKKMVLCPNSSIVVLISCTLIENLEL